MNHEINATSKFAGPLVPTATLANGPMAEGVIGFAAGAPAATTPPLTPACLWRALRRRLAIALGAGMLAAGVFGTAAWFLVPQAKYKAQAELHIYAQPPKIIFHTTDRDELAGGAGFESYQKTQIAWVKSRLVLNAALQQPSVSRFQTIRQQDEPMKWLQEKLEVGFEAGPEILTIALSGEYPAELAALVNAVKDAYMEEVVNKEHEHRFRRAETLKKLKERFAESIKGHRERLKKLAETAGSDDRGTLVLKQQFAEESLQAVKQELLEVRSRKRRLEAQRKLQRPQEDSAPDPQARRFAEEVVLAEIDRHPLMVDLRKRLEDAETKLQTESASTSKVARNFGSDPWIKRMRNYVGELRKRLAAKEKELRPIVQEQLARRGAGGAEGAGGGTLDDELAVTDELEQRLNAEIKLLSDGSHNLTMNTLDLSTIQEDMAQSQAAAQKIGSEVEALNVELEAPLRVVEMEPAIVPRTKDDKKRFAMIGVCTLGSFFAAILGIVLLELQSQKIDSADEVASGLGLPVVGALPILPSRARRGGRFALQAKHRYWYNQLLESIDATRTMLVHAARSGSHRVVMISSALPGEGKTSVASHLATSMARSGLKTLLIDADLRRPSIHRLFDLAPEPGLSGLLRGEVGLDDAIVPASIEELSVIPAGRCDQQTLRILAQGGLGALFGQLKERFEFVIVDSSPILPLADALIIAQQVDAVLFSVIREVSRKTKIFAATQKLHALGVRVLGAVVTGDGGSVYGGDYDAARYYDRGAQKDPAAHADAVGPMSEL